MHNPKAKHKSKAGSAPRHILSQAATGTVPRGPSWGLSYDTRGDFVA